MQRLSLDSRPQDFLGRLLGRLFGVRRYRRSRIFCASNITNRKGAFDMVKTVCECLALVAFLAPFCLLMFA